MRPLRLDPALFPACVTVHALSLDAPDEAQPLAFAGVALPPDLERAALKRRVEFLAGRFCAQAALRAHAPALAAHTVPRGADRAPEWPAGVVGTITHTQGYAAAAVAHEDSLRGIGLDLERWVRPTAPANLGAHLARPGELARLVAESGWSEVEALTLLFSAKESLYKCLYPEVRRYFGFHDATIATLDTHARTFVARLETPLTDALPAGFTLTGRFERRDDAIATALVLQAE
jgi:4'-phosphopantetheinyl transferase EntD